jgi:hypothetical protein
MAMLVISVEKKDASLTCFIWIPEIEKQRSDHVEKSGWTTISLGVISKGIEIIERYAMRVSVHLCVLIRCVVL